MIPGGSRVTRGVILGVIPGVESLRVSADCEGCTPCPARTLQQAHYNRGGKRLRA